jgi:hypothetical protein
VKNNEATNPFVFDSVQSNATQSRRLDYTPDLIATANARAQELMIAVGKKPELFELANRAIDGGNPQDLINLIEAVHSKETIHTDAKLLEGADENQLSRLLESRRSDRSKAKKKGPRSSALVCRTYISAMYAELMIRDYWQKPYAGSSTGIKVDTDDLDTINRRIKSLQSKKSRLKKLAEYDADAQAELKDVEAEIDRLNQFRPNSRQQSRTVIKDLNVDQVRSILLQLNPEELGEEERQRYEALMAKLG